MGNRLRPAVALGSSAGRVEIYIGDWREGMMLHEMSDLLLDSRVVHKKAVEARHLQEVGHPLQFGFLD